MSSIAHSLKYRPEVDGLRALAVIPVVLFHLNPSLMRGGFVGVDVFFVISGYLITSIIHREAARGTFTLRDFWARRIRRIFPALSVVLITTLVAGYFILFSDEWMSLGRQAVAVMLLVANFSILREASDYWGTAAEELPLLHTWSLSVEEQFYLLFPIIFVVLFRHVRRHLVAIMTAGALLSFVACIYGTWKHPGAAFYLIPTRAWELLVGCILAVWERERQEPLHGMRWAPVLANLGLGLIFASIFLIDGIPFPGYIAAVPCLGAFLIIGFSGAGRSAADWLLRIPAVVFVGRISYSLYLWHWPVIVLARYGGWHTPIGLFIVSLCLAVLSYYLVEKPTRQAPGPLLFKWVVPAMGLVLIASIRLPFAIQRDAMTYPVPDFIGDVDMAPMVARDVPRKRELNYLSSGLVWWAISRPA